MKSPKQQLTSQITVPKMPALAWLKEMALWPLLDVRSEGEFQEGYIPGSISAPILNNEERHQVGITYKQKGQSAAIALGLSLVESHRELRIEGMLKNITSSVAVSCWRGGLRSRFASGWLQDARKDSLNVVQITGGYKAIRNQLLTVINTPREMWIVGGMTGSGKTILLKELELDTRFPISQVLDLEGMASHRGSSFGNNVSSSGEKIKQPRQQTFENLMGLHLFKSNGPIVVENESTLIGQVFIPEGFRSQMRLAPVVVLETPVLERVLAIFKEYVEAPIQAGCSPEKLWNILEGNIKVLERRLGGKETSELLKHLKDGASDPLNLERQTTWIQPLLERYYDKAYTRSSQLAQRNVVFTGDKTECKDWLCDQMAKRN